MSGATCCKVQERAHFVFVWSGCPVQEAGVTRGLLFANVSLWSYSSANTAWEPVIEPWQVLAHTDINSVGRSRAGVSPGTWVHLTSTQTDVSACLSQSTLAALLLAAKEWRAVIADEAGGAMLPDREPGSQVQVENALGVEVEVAVDTGNSVPVRGPHACTQLRYRCPHAACPDMYLLIDTGLCLTALCELSCVRRRWRLSSLASHTSCGSRCLSPHPAPSLRPARATLPLSA